METVIIIGGVFLGIVFLCGGAYFFFKGPSAPVNSEQVKKGDVIDKVSVQKESNSVIDKISVQKESNSVIDKVNNPNRPPLDWLDKNSTAHKIERMAKKSIQQGERFRGKGGDKFSSISEDGSLDLTRSIDWDISIDWNEIFCFLGSSCCSCLIFFGVVGFFY